ncbi:MAG: CMD domain protein [Chloroflexota bacterium]
MAHLQHPDHLEPPDVIDALAGVAADSALADLRRGQSEVTRAAQASFAALFEPDDLGTVSRIEREAIGLRVAALTPNQALVDWHRRRLTDLGTDQSLIDAACQPTVPAGVLPVRLQAILDHTERLTRAPGQAGPEHVQALARAGLSPRDIVTVSQIIAFLSYQVRVLATLRALGAEA